MKKPIHICFFSGKRGGFNHLVPILELVQKDPEMEASLLVSDMHLSASFGRTVEEVEKYCGRIYRVETLMGADSKVSRAKSIGVGVLGMADLLAAISPDLLFVLGDRGELLAPMICALELNIPIAHLFGGDVTRGGGVDEVMRHAYTKMAGVHFTSNGQSARRVLRMGEERWRLHNVGAPALDLIKQGRFNPPEVIYEKFGLKKDESVLVLLQHSVTWKVEQAGRQMERTMQAVDSLGYQCVAVHPCSDPGYSAIVGTLEKYSDRPFIQVHKNLEFPDFWGLLNAADVMVGNSSAGVMETPSFGLPCVNIGERQRDRLRADNVIDADHDSDEIRAAIRKSLFDQKFKDMAGLRRSPYGDGNAAKRIVKVLKSLPYGERLLKKEMTY